MEARRALGSGGGASVIGEVFVFAKIAETFGLKKTWREEAVTSGGFYTSVKSFRGKSVYKILQY